jgi:primosomal protein N' (replication factor Y) (superfamily II helicase)
VDVVVAVPKLELDRPFTYLLPEGTGAGVGSLVSVPFHGRTLKGWIVGPASDEVPESRLRPVRTVRSPVRFFDDGMLRLLRWVSERYIVPLSTVIERAHPPRVAGEDRTWRPVPAGAAVVGSRTSTPGAFDAGSVTWCRPLPGDEASACVQAVTGCLAAGRRAIVLVPRADPLPFTARAVLDAAGERAIAFVAGDPRARYRAWLRIASGDADVVVATRPGVFAPLGELGLIWISRETHPAHREDRSPSYHVREVAAARARLDRAACVVASFSPSVATAWGIRTGGVRVRRPPRTIERRRAPLVETARPEAEDRSPRLTSLVRRAHSAALIVTRTGYGMARVCRACGAPAACTRCRGVVVLVRGTHVCRACGAPARCARCSATLFGLERGGTERILEWARGVARVPVDAGLPEPDGVPPGEGRVVVGTAAMVDDVGPVRVDLVGLLDPDRALSRSDLHAVEQTLAVWMEAAVWAGPKEGGGRVLAQTRSPRSALVQALIRWEPLDAMTAVGQERARAGFPPDHPTFRIEGPAGGGLGETLRACGATTVLETAVSKGTVCLVALPPEKLGGFRAGVLALVARGGVTRVEAEPTV